MQAMPDPAGQKNMKRKGSPVKIQVDFNQKIISIQISGSLEIHSSKYQY